MLKLNERFLTALIESIPNAIYLKDENGKYILINESGAKAVGKDVKNFIGKDDTEVFSEELGTKVMELDQQVFKNGKFDGEEVVDEDTVFYSHKFIIKDKQNGQKILAGISTDISELKKTEKELSAARKKAEEANEHKTIFLQNMSHELRTPLNAIIGFSSMLCGEGGIQSPQTRENFAEYAKLINTSGKHLLTIINDLLDLSKVESGEQEFSESEIDVLFEVDACIKMLKNMASEKSIIIEEDHPEKDIILKGDEKIFRQLLFNLLSNAIKYSPAGNTVSLKIGLRDDHGLTVTVIDNGIGMSEEDMDVALIPFRRASQVKNSDIAGTGLGLPLVNAFIKLYQGEFKLKSKPGIGTKASLWFPAERTLEY